MTNILSEILKHMPLKEVVQIIPLMVYDSIEQLSEYNEDEYTEKDIQKLKKIIIFCQKGIEALEIASLICSDLISGKVKDPDQLLKLKNWSVGNPTRFKG